MRSASVLFVSLLLIAGGCAAPVVTAISRGGLAGGGLQLTSTLEPGEPNNAALGAESPQTGEPDSANPAAADSPIADSPIADSATSGAAWLERWLYPKRVVWQQWGETHLQTGDLVFTRGNYYLLLGAINFSDLLSTVSESPFSHVGIVAIEDGQAMVYEISDSGLRSTPFARYVTQSNFERVAVRRPAPELYSMLPEVIRFIRQKQADGVSFDRHFDLQNESFYCSELIVNAFAAGGIELAQPLPAGELPGLSDASPWSLTVARLATGLELTDPVYTVGNASSGLYGSPWLIECLPPTEI